MTFTLPTINTGDNWTAANANTYWRDPINLMADWPHMELNLHESFADTTGNNATVSKVEGSVATKPSWYIGVFPAANYRSRAWVFGVPDYFEPDDISDLKKTNTEFWFYGSAQADTAKFVRWYCYLGPRVAGDALTGSYNTQNFVDIANFSTTTNDLLKVATIPNEYVFIKTGEIGFFLIARDGPNDDAAGNMNLFHVIIRWRNEPS